MSIRIEGIEELIKRIDTLEQLKHTVAALVKGAKHVQRKARLYPRKPGRPQPFVSDKQRRGFFYHLKRGNITVPYSRTMAVKRGWQIESRNDGLTQIIENSEPHAKLVQSPEGQTRYHATTGWQTTTQVAASEGPTVVALVREGLQKDVSG